MPPIEQSLRGTLLTGASALALSVTGYSAQAQVTQTPVTQPQWTVWVEGALFETGGKGMNVPTLPDLTAPFTTVGPKGGLEGAGGFDYNWAGPWHAVFDFRYGRSRTASTSSQSQSSSHTTFTSHSGFKTFFSSTTTNTSSTQTEWERENHFVADFMVGRDFGLGSTTGEIQFGIRVADLSATAWAQQSGQSTTTTHFTSFYLRDPFNTGGSTFSSSETASAAWWSRFFGAGPRVAATGTVPLWAAWSVDYEAGVAGLVGNRSFNYAVTVSPGGSFSANNSSTVFIFNTDAWAGLSYALGPQAKVTGGIRADYYADPLITYSVAGGVTNVDRVYWGPFLRLTGKF